MDFESIQGRLLFGRATRIRPLQQGPHAGGYARTALRLERPDGAVLEGWSATPTDGPAQGVVLYFGGRNENVVWAPDMASFNPRHAIYAFNYRGFGNSTGHASERRAKADAQAILDVVLARESPAGLTLAGRSLGTAIALSLVPHARPSRLVLMSPFDSAAHVARARRLGWLPAALMTQRFDCAHLAAAHAGKTLVLLAEHERSVPHEQSRRLAARLPAAPWIHVIAGTTHASLPRSAGAQAAVAQFLRAEAGPGCRRP